MWGGGGGETYAVVGYKYSHALDNVILFSMLFSRRCEKIYIRLMYAERTKRKFDIRIVFKLYFRSIHALSSLLYFFSRADNAELIFLRISELLISHQILLLF